MSFARLQNDPKSKESPEKWRSMPQDSPSLLPNPYSHPKSSPFSLSSAWATCAPLCNANYGPIIPGHCQFLWEHKRCAPGIGIEMGITRYKIVSRRENVLLSDAYSSGKWARREEWSRSWPGRFGFTLRTGWDRIGSTRVGSVRFSLEWNGVKLVELLGLTARSTIGRSNQFVCRLRRRRTCAFVKRNRRLRTIHEIQIPISQQWKCAATDTTAEI